MRRRRTINIWPAFADLMTVLAVFGLFTTLALAQDMQRRLAQAARNQKMFEAIEQAQKAIESIQTSSGLAFAPDQTLRFGDDLVSFDLNGVVPHWRADGPLRLRSFCRAVGGTRGPSASAGDLQGRFVVEVQGHTDASECPRDANCNWRISSARAAAFVGLMRDELFCPGGLELDLRPTGYAWTKPERTGGPPTRRIAVRIVPNYERLMNVAK